MSFIHLRPAHILTKHQIPQIVLVIITKIIRGQEALSLPRPPAPRAKPGASRARPWRAPEHPRRALPTLPAGGIARRRHRPRPNAPAGTPTLFLLDVHAPLDTAYKRPGRCLARVHPSHLPELATAPALPPPSRASPSARGRRRSTIPSSSLRPSIPARDPSC
jgi:hypothetical protein